MPTVPDLIASKSKTKREALASAATVFECGLINSLILGKVVADVVDGKLYELELAYYRRADELARPVRKGAKGG